MKLAVGGHAQVALVLAILVVGEDHEATRADLGHGHLDRNDHIRPFRRHVARFLAQHGQGTRRHRLGHPVTNLT